MTWETWPAFRNVLSLVSGHRIMFILSIKDLEKNHCHFGATLGGGASVGVLGGSTVKGLRSEKKKRLGTTDLHSWIIITLLFCACSGWKILEFCFSQTSQAMSSLLYSLVCLLKRNKVSLVIDKKTQIKTPKMIYFL